VPSNDLWEKVKNPFQAGGMDGSLSISSSRFAGPPSSPVCGGVIAFWKGRHWYGRGISFKGNAQTGAFVAERISERGSHGRATVSYRC
jgi:hypothetical protein